MSFERQYNDDNDNKEKRRKSWSVRLIETIIVIVALGVAASYFTSDRSSTPAATEEVPLDESATRVSSTVSRSRAAMHLTSGETYYNEGNYSKAIESFTLALAAEPENTEALIGRARSYSELENFEAAIGDLAHVLSIDDTHEEAYYERGRLYLELEQYEAAELDFRNAVEFGYEIRAYPAYFEGLARFYQDDFVGTIASLDRSIRFDPDCEYECGHDYYLRGRARHHLGDLDEALVDYTAAIEHHYPDVTDVYYFRAEVYHQQGNAEAALEDLEWSLKTDPQCEHACEVVYHLRGEVYLQQGQTQAAIGEFDEAIRIDPNYVDAYDSRTTAYALLGESEKALADYDQVLRLQSRSVFQQNLNERSSLGSTITLAGRQIHVPYEGTAGQAIEIRVTTEESVLKAVVALRDPAGRLIAYEIAQEDADPVPIALTLAQDGTYTIVVAGKDAESTGLFQLRVRQK